MIYVDFEIKSQETALLIIDMQNDCVKEKGALASSGLWKVVKKDGVIENIARVVKACRQADIPIFHIKTVHRKDMTDVVETITNFSLSVKPPAKRRNSWLVEGTWGSKIIDELKPRREDYIIEKRRGDAFYNTDLELLLRSRSVRTLIITGVRTDGCLGSTVFSAGERDFNIILLIDCISTMKKEIQDFWVNKIFPLSAVTAVSNEFVKNLLR